MDVKTLVVVYVYCVSHSSAGNHVFNGDTLYCVLHAGNGNHGAFGSTIVEVRQGGSPFAYALPDDLTSLLIHLDYASRDLSFRENRGGSI